MSDLESRDLRPTASDGLAANADDVAVGRNALSGYAVLGGESCHRADSYARPASRPGDGGVRRLDAGSSSRHVRRHCGTRPWGRDNSSTGSALAHGDVQRASAVAASARAAYLVMAGAGALVLILLVTLAGSFIDSEGLSPDRTRVTVAILGLGFVLSSAASVYPAIAIGAGRADLGAKVGIGSRIVMAAAQMVVVLTTGSIVLLAIVTAASILGGTLVLRAVTRRVFGYIDVSLKNAGSTVVRALLSSGWRNGAIAIAAAVAIQTDVLVVGAMLRIVRWLPTASLCARLWSLSFWPHVPQTCSSPRLHIRLLFMMPNAPRQQLEKSVFLTRAILLPTVVVLVAFGDALLHLWLQRCPRIPSAFWWSWCWEEWQLHQGTRRSCY